MRGREKEVVGWGRRRGRRMREAIGFAVSWYETGYRARVGEAEFMVGVRLTR